MPKGFHSEVPFQLLQGENIVFKTNPHWLLLAAPVTGIFFIWLIHLFLICPFLEEMILFELCYTLTSFIFLSTVLILYLDWRFNRLYLTNIRLIKERGIIGKRFMSIWLERIEDIECSYGILGWIFGFGDLIIESAGTYGKMVFKGFPSPRKIKLKIEREILYV